MSKERPSAKGEAPATSDRETRLKEALRENLRRRKAQARARKDTKTDKD